MDTGRAHSTFLEIAAAFIIRSRLGAARDPQARELMPFRWISSRRRRSALAPGSGGAFGCVFCFFSRARKLGVVAKAADWLLVLIRAADWLIVSDRQPISGIGYRSGRLGQVHWHRRPPRIRSAPAAASRCISCRFAVGRERSRRGGR